MSVVALVAALSACNKQDSKPLTMPSMPADSNHAGVNPQGMGEGMGMAHGGARKESQVVVPEAVKAQWKSARIAVVDRATGKESVQVVPFGTDKALPGTNLTIRLENPLPDFSMGDGVITTKSEKLENPALQLRVSEDGKEVFKGWLFAKFPDTHAFNHPKVGLKLVEFVH